MTSHNRPRPPFDALVLDGSARQALVATRALGRFGLRIATAESSDLCDPPFQVPPFASRWSAREDVLPSYHHEPTAYGDALIDFVSAHPTRVVLPSMDGSIAALRSRRSEFERHGAALALASDAALDLANDKTRTLAVAAELGVPRPRTVAIDCLEDTSAALRQVGFPAVIKPTISWVVSGADVATRVISRAVLDESEGLEYVQQLLELGGSAIVQEMATGPREALCVFYAGGTVWAKFAQVAYRTTPVLGGVSVVRESINLPADLESAAVALVRSLDLQGYSEVEFRRDAGGRPLLMEINARLSGSLEVAVRSGVPFPTLLWQWAAGEPLTAASGYRTGTKMRYLKGDMKWLRENIETRGRRPDGVSPLSAVALFARGFLERQSYDYLDRGDLGPASAALAANLSAARRKLTRERSPAPRKPVPALSPRRTAMSTTDVAIIGVGPNGLSVAAHLEEAGIDYRAFGRTMGAWRFHMPAGMILKSEPYASDLSAPSSGFLARDYCRQAHEVYHDRVIPLTREQFIDYGMWFADRLVPGIDEAHVVSLSPAPGRGFSLETEHGERVDAARVVVSTGVIPFSYVPPELAGLPSDLVSHSSEHANLERFLGQEVLVVGGGSSALETATLLHEQGTAVKVVIRDDSVFWPPPNPAHPGRLDRMRRPVARLCEGWPCWAYDRLPDVFRLLPEQTRVERALGFLGPQGAWWLRERTEGRVPMLFEHRVLAAEKVGDRVRLRLQTPNGEVSECADHVIAGTGYRLDLNRLDYIAPSLRAGIKTAAGAPVLNRSLESSVPGLYFTGALAAPSLGPLMRFVAGTHFTAPRIVHKLRRSRV